MERFVHECKVPQDLLGSLSSEEDKKVAEKCKKLLVYAAEALKGAKKFCCEYSSVWLLPNGVPVQYTPGLVTIEGSADGASATCVLHDWKSGKGPTPEQVKAVNAFVSGGCNGLYPDSTYAKDVFQANMNRIACAQNGIDVGTVKLVYAGGGKDHVVEVIVPHLTEEFVYVTAMNVVTNAADARVGKASNAMYFEGRKLLAVVWAMTDAVDMFARYPETLSMDITCLTNNRRLPFIALVGMDGFGRNFVAVSGLLPNEQGATFRWFLSEAVPALLGQTNLAATTQVIADENAQEHSALTHAKVKGILPNAEFRYCGWHCLNQVRVYLS